MSVVDEVKQKTDIVEVIGRHVALKKAGRNFRALCPFHTEKAPSFYVFPERQSWHCFGACNTGGDVFSFVMKQQGIDFGEALRLLAQEAGVTVPDRTRPDPRKDEREKLHQVNEAAADYFRDQLLKSPDAARARDYLQCRGLTPQTVSAFKLGYAPNSWEALKRHLGERGYTEQELLDAGLLAETGDGRTRDRFHDRLMFPIHDPRGRTTGFGARALDDSLPKYTNSPQTLVFDKSGTLYAVDLAAPAIRKQDRAVIVEGYMDVITAHQNGFTNVVASMGTSVTYLEKDNDRWRTFNEPEEREARRAGAERSQKLNERQLNVLRKLTRNIYLALDADAAGREAMLRCVDYENALNAEVRVIVLPADRDPDDVIREDPSAWQRLVDDAVPVLDFALEMSAASLDLTAARDQVQLIREFLPVLARMRDALRRDHYLRKLETRTGIRYNTIEAALKEQLAASRPAQGARERVERSTAATLYSSARIEEECLSLLLQHPELKDGTQDLLPDYFQNSQNREIFAAWKDSPDLEALKERLDPAMWEHVDGLASRPLLASNLDRRLPAYVLRLREEYLRDLKSREAAALSRTGEENGDSDALATLEEEALQRNAQLREVFTQKARSGRSGRDEPRRVR